MQYRRNAASGHCDWLDLFTTLGRLTGARDVDSFYREQEQDFRYRIAQFPAGHPMHGTSINARLQAFGERQLYLSGNPFVNLYPGIAEMLSTTNISIPATEVQLPFEAFTIRLPRENNIMLKSDTGKPDENLCAILISKPDAQLMRDTGFTEDSVLIQWQTTAKHIDGPLIEGLIIRLRQGFTVDEEIQASINIARSRGTDTTDDEIQTVFRIAIGTIFLAISRDRRYVSQERIRIKANDLCFCGSGQKYKRCCGRNGIQRTGLGIGKEISLPSQRSTQQRIVSDPTGEGLRYSHLRSGHMRWQPYKDEQGEWQRRLIFIHPLMVRPDLPLPPTGPTPRGIREPRRGLRRYRKNMDERLRLAQRYDDIEDQVRHLVQRVRSGETSYPRIELAAFLWDEPSRRLLTGEGVIFVDTIPHNLFPVPDGINWVTHDRDESMSRFCRAANKRCWRLNWRPGPASLRRPHPIQNSSAYCRQIDPSGEFARNFGFRMIMACLHKLFQLHNTLTSTSEQIEVQIQAETYTRRLVKQYLEDDIAGIDVLVTELYTRYYQPVPHGPWSWSHPFFYMIARIAEWISHYGVDVADDEPPWYLTEEIYLGLRYTDVSLARDRGIISFGAGFEDIKQAMAEEVIPWVLEISDPLADKTMRSNPDDEGKFVINRPYGQIEVELTEWTHPDTGKPIAQVKWITVDEERQGFGTKLYDLAAAHARKLGYVLASDDDLSEGALGYWQKQKRLRRAEEYYYDMEDGPSDQEFQEGFDPTIFINDRR